MTSTLVDVGRVTTGIVAALQATIEQAPTYILVGDHERPVPAADADVTLYANRPRLEVYRRAIGPPKTVGRSAGGFTGQTGAMEWVRHELRMAGGQTRAHVDYALDLAVAVLTERDPDGSWAYPIDLDGGQSIIAREPGGRGNIEPPFGSDSFAVSTFVDVWVHASG